jgi:hypothetical protein
MIVRGPDAPGGSGSAAALVEDRMTGGFLLQKEPFGAQPAGVRKTEKRATGPVQS